MRKELVMCATLALGLATRTAGAAEVCGNDQDDDGNGMVDEGCAPTLTTGVCESPLSCGDVGMVSWTTGALHYDLPADIAPKMPFGVGIGLRRFYTSMYAPGTTPTSVNHKPLGDRWQHTYMVWIHRFQVGTDWKIVLHTSEGRDVYATRTSIVGGWEYYTPQAGFHVMSIQYNTVSPNQFQVQLLTGETLYFNSSGQLTQIWDNLKPTPNKVIIAWTSTSNGNVSTVTDAAGYHRLKFNYTSNLLTSVNLQLLISGVWTTQHTTTYGYTSGVLTSATIGSQLAQQYSYNAGYLTSITDGSGGALATFSWDGTTPGKVDRIDKPDGSVGLEYSSARAACSGKTIMYFNQASSTSCSTDSDCSAVGYLCGGYNGTAGSGRCYFAGRCLTTGAANSESVVTAVTPLTNDHNPCDGACTDVAQYVWSSDPTLLNVLGTADPMSPANYTSAIYNANGLPTQITYGDNDAIANNMNPAGSRTVFITYDATYPGRISSTARTSDLYPGSSACTGTGANCAVTSYTFNSTDGTLQTLTQTGTTLDSSGTPIPYTYSTSYTHDSQGRLSEVDGPVSGMKTTFSYYSSTSAPLTYGFLQNYSVYKDATNALTTNILAYDFWGNVTGRKDPDTTVSCRTFDTSRDYLTQTREAMAGQTDCSTPNGSDLTTSFARDSALRLTQVTQPDSSCVFYAYTGGRLATIKRRDDCNAASSGDYQSLSYSSDGQLTELDTFNASGSQTASKQYTYYDSRRLDSIVNPVDTTKAKYLTYDARGATTEIDDEASLGKAVYTINNDSRITAEQRYKTSSTYDTWTLLYDWLGDQSQVTDGDSKTTQSVRDDLSRFVKLASPDMTYPTVKLFDAAGRITSKIEGVGSPRPLTLTHGFTFDFAGRPLNDDYSGNCPTGTPHAEIQRVYDGMPAGVTCPITGGCNNVAGRLAYVKVILMCSSAYTDDSSLDQETFYSYDAAGRVVDEYIRDDSGRIADQQSAWTKNGALSQLTTPSTATVAWSFGSGTSNSDTDRITAIAVNGTNALTNILWYPFGPLQQYTQQDSIGGSALRTVITRNVAYRVSNIQMQTSGSVEEDGVNLSEDAKGRVVTRDYFDTAQTDSYFLYDEQDRVLCETTSFVSSCPTTAGSTVKNSHFASPPFTNAGDWVSLLRWNTTAVGENLFSLNTGNHQIAQDYQHRSALGKTLFTYNSYGDRGSDYGTHWNTHHIDRTYTYDARHNVVNVRFEYPYWTCSGFPRTCSYVWHFADTASAFDARGRRVFKSVHDETTGWYSNTFFYYDALDRLIEVRYIPDISNSGTYSIYQLAWLGQRPVMYYQSDYPGPTVSKRYPVTDETNRIIAMWSWPASGDAARVWEVNPTAWGDDWPIMGSSVYQPLWFAGQYMDEETRSYMDDGATFHQRGLVLSGARTYDPFSGGLLQLDASKEGFHSSYVFANSNPVAADGGSPSGTGVTRVITSANIVPSSTCNKTYTIDEYDGAPYAMPAPEPTKAPDPGTPPVSHSWDVPLTPGFGVSEPPQSQSPWDVASQPATATVGFLPSYTNVLSPSLFPNVTNVVVTDVYCGPIQCPMKLGDGCEPDYPVVCIAASEGPLKGHIVPRPVFFVAPEKKGSMCCGDKCDVCIPSPARPCLNSNGGGEGA